MNIKSAITTEGMPLKIIPFSAEMITNVCDDEAFQNILCCRMQTYYDSFEYKKTHEEFRFAYSEIEANNPELKKPMLKVDGLVVTKEVQCFDAGFKAGMADLMTALTFNDLQIINTQLCDMKAIAEKREAAKKPDAEFVEMTGKLSEKNQARLLQFADGLLKNQTQEVSEDE
ncbi:MAG: hypothetical protein FIA99_05520 [Ruminiclostridium sp.]|nr:hypothetical protein [Ruminiclostridium sp.]